MYPQPWKAHKNYPTYIHPKTVGMIYIIIKKIPQSVGWIYPYFYKCIFPNPTPEHSNNHSKWWVSNTNINIQFTYILSKLFAAYIPQIVVFNTNLYFNKYIFPNSVPEGRTETPTTHPAPKCWPDISNTHICVQLTFIPQIVGCIYPIRYLYFFKMWKAY